MAGAGSPLGLAWPERAGLRVIAGIVALAIGVLVLTLSAKVQVPSWPVPMTLQTLAVLALAMTLGLRLGVAIVAAYLLAGAVGWPVFAGTPERGIGLSYMMGPTGGFLAGFVVAAGVTGVLAERGWARSVLLCAAAMLFGHALILLSGTAWLATFVGLQKAIQVGLTPFLIPSLIKTALGALCVPLIMRLFGREPGTDA